MFYLILIIWIITDLFTKNLALVYLQDRVDIFWSFLYLSYVENTWIAFSIQIPSFFLKILTISLIILIFYYYIKEKEKQKQTLVLDISFWLILSWAIANWYERVFNSKVIDFIWVKYFSVFNLADSFITIWALLYLYILFKTKKIF